jgi:hypothetical protein
VRSFSGLADFIAASGEHLGHGEWHEATQDQVNAFARGNGRPSVDSR